MLALIIWGSRSSESMLGQGQFWCPRCNQTTPFVHRKVQRYFTLYFIPLFPIGAATEFVECAYCRGKFQTSVLHQQQLPPQGGWPQGPQGGWPPQGGPPQGGQGWGR